MIFKKKNLTWRLCLPFGGGGFIFVPKTDLLAPPFGSNGWCMFTTVRTGLPDVPILINACGQFPGYLWKPLPHQCDNFCEPPDLQTGVQPTVTGAEHSQVTQPTASGQKKFNVWGMFRFLSEHPLGILGKPPFSLRRFEPKCFSFLAFLPKVVEHCEMGTFEVRMGQDCQRLWACPCWLPPPLKLGGLPPIAAWTYIKPNLGSYLMMNCFESGQSGWCSLTCGDTKVRTQYEFRQKYLFSLHHLINFSTNPNIPPYEGTTVWSNLVIWQWNHTHSMSIFSRAQWLMKIMMHTNSFPAKWPLELRQKHVDSSEINPSEDKNFELLWTSSLLPVMAE